MTKYVMAFISGCMVLLALMLMADNTPTTAAAAAGLSDWSSFGTKPAEWYADNKTARNYYIVVDGSGSMNNGSCSGAYSSKLEAAKFALHSFLREMSDNDNVGLYAFDNNSRAERVKLQPRNLRELDAAVDQIDGGDSTPLRTAIAAGYVALEEQARHQLGLGEYTIVVVTDGDASIGEDPSALVDHITDISPVRIYTVGFCIGANHALNRDGVTAYVSATSPESLKAGLTGALAEAESFQLLDFNNAN